MASGLLLATGTHLAVVSQPTLAAQLRPGPVHQSKDPKLGEVSFGMSQGRLVALASEQVYRMHSSTLECPHGSGVAPPRLVCTLPLCTQVSAPCRDCGFIGTRHFVSIGRLI